MCIQKAIKQIRFIKYLFRTLSNLAEIRSHGFCPKSCYRYAYCLLQLSSERWKASFTMQIAISIKINAERKANKLIAWNRYNI